MVSTRKIQLHWAIFVQTSIEQPQRLI